MFFSGLFSTTLLFYLAFSFDNECNKTSKSLWSFDEHHSILLFLLLAFPLMWYKECNKTFKHLLSITLFYCSGENPDIKMQHVFFIPDCRYVYSSQGKYVEAKKCFLEVIFFNKFFNKMERIALFYRLLNWSPVMRITRKI